MSEDESPSIAKAEISKLAASETVRLISSDSFSFREAVGGIRGLIESSLPCLIFVLSYVISGQLKISLILSLGSAVLACLARLVQRTPLTQAVSGLFGVAIAVLFAWGTGRSENYFLWGLITNSVTVVVLLLTILIRKPGVSLVVGILRDLPSAWWRDAQYASLAKRCLLVTWLWVVVFAVRLVVQVPLWAVGNVPWLGTARIAMGIPLFAFAAWISWILLRETAPKTSRLELSPEPSATEQ